VIDPVGIGLAGQTEQKEQTEFRERKVKGREQKLQAGHGDLGTRLEGRG